MFWAVAPGLGYTALGTLIAHLYSLPMRDVPHTLSAVFMAVAITPVAHLSDVALLDYLSPTIIIRLYGTILQTRYPAFRAQMDTDVRRIPLVPEDR